MLFQDFTGQKFNHLTVVRRRMVEGSKKTFWDCVCDCGEPTTVCAHSLKNSLIQSCGCMKASTISARKTKHGGAGTGTYKSWTAMMRRCHNPKDTAFAYYGGAGITVDPQWHDYPAFLADMGERPPGMTLDRIEGHKGYGPGNCQWATMEQQNRNKPSVRKHRAFGQEMFVWEWAEHAGIKPATLRKRLRAGASMEAALSPPTQVHGAFAVASDGGM